MLTPDESVTTKLSAAISDVLGTQSEMVTKWVVMIESMDEEGNRGVWTVTNEDAMPWDTLGIMMFGIQREQSRLVVDELKRDGGFSE